MRRQIDNLIDYTKMTLNLENYILRRHQIYKRDNLFNEISYTLSMEWFPEHLIDWDDPELNPDGAAIIEINIHTRKFVSIVFVGEKSFVKQPLLQQVAKEQVIQWIEQETELIYGEKFRLKQSTENEYLFIATWKDIRVYPPASIEVKFDHSNRLVFYSNQGYFPESSQIIQEKYRLTLAQVEELSFQQLKLINFPNNDSQSLHPLYAIEEIFVTNNGFETISYEPVTDEHQIVEVNKVIKWKTPLQDMFVAGNLTLTSEVSVEEALAEDRPKRLINITPVVQDRTFHAVKSLLRQKYPDESGEWRLQLLYRENNYLVAVVRQTDETNLVFKRKLTVFIDQNTFEVVNLVDNKVMLDTFKNYTQAGSPKVTPAEAYERLKEHLTLEPVYVFDQSTGKYILCGKLDCQYGVDAITGKVIRLDEL